MPEEQEEFKISSKEIKEKVKQIIEAGNARKIIIKKETGEVIMEIPLTWGAVGVILVPVLAAVGAITAVVTKCTIVVVKK